MRIELPELCLVALVGATGSGKSTFAAKHFKPTEVLSSDFFRGLISDDENNQRVSREAFECLFYVAEKRLDAGRLTVLDATHIQKYARELALRLAKEQNCFAAAIVLDMPPELCLERNSRRESRRYPAGVVHGHARELKRNLKSLKKEGFHYIYVLKTPEEADNAHVVLTRLWNNRKDDSGPFDVIGDIHGCYDELCALLEKLGYAVDGDACGAVPPTGENGRRKAVFLGDLCDRGPENVKVLKLVMNMVAAGNALCIAGNHDAKLLKKLQGANVQATHGLDVTLEQLDREPPEFPVRARDFLQSLISHYVLDNGNLVVAHAGLKEKLQGRSSGAVRQFCLYGETTGETDEYGLPVRLDWAGEYRGKALVLYGHTPCLNAQSLNNTICLDTGCVFGGRLSAYRYPERELVDVPANRQYYAPAKPLEHKGEDRGDMLDIRDVQGKRHISTALLPDITVHEENAAAALEIMSRFAVDPHWLIYLPPTMSPCETSSLEGWLEHPREAFAYYRKQGVAEIVCEEKHMGSRAVITLCRNAEAARERFGVADGSSGIIYTRTGRRFFDEQDGGTEETLLRRLGDALESTGFWERYATNWLCLDCELMPWSAKAGVLLRTQYAPVGLTGGKSLAGALRLLERAAAREALAPTSAAPDDKSITVADILARYRERQEQLGLFTDAYRRYCWTVAGPDDLRVAPFHILATEGKVWNRDTHLTHLAVVREHMAVDPMFLVTDSLCVHPDNEEECALAEAWWLELTEKGGEGMVVKPLDFLPSGNDGQIQPAVKCRGKEYLRIIYGPEYTQGEHLARLKKRSLNRKRRLALQEFALGMESLERFARREPLYRVHECVFAVLALESEAVDPRL